MENATASILRRLPTLGMKVNETKENKDPRIILKKSKKQNV